MKQISIFLFFVLFYSSAWAGYRGAKATAVVVNGFLVDATITDSGEGYSVAPSVMIMGGGGTGAMAESEITNGGTVSKIRIRDAGNGYTNAPIITIAEPEVKGLVNITMLPALVLTNSVGAWMTIFYSEQVESTNWVPLSTVLVNSNPYLFVDTDGWSKPRRFYRAEPDIQPSLAPAVLNNHKLRVQITGGPFAPASYDIVMTGANSGTFVVMNGSEGWGNYVYTRSRSNGATLTLSYTNPAGGDRDVMDMTFNSAVSGSFIGSQLVSGPGGELIPYNNFAGTFQNFGSR